MLCSPPWLDVLVVRLVVAPAVMTLLGDRAWGLPSWRERVLPSIAPAGGADDRPALAPSIPEREREPAGA